MKILMKGNVFNPTGIACANREIVKALDKLGVEVQCADVWHSGFDFNKGMEKFNKAIDGKKVDATIFSDYPQRWFDGYGKLIGCPIHEGTRLPQGWAETINTVDKIMVASEATRNLFKWNDVVVPTKTINYGVDPEVYNPGKKEESEEFVFLSVNSWSGDEGDRKGTDILIKAFNEEFKGNDKVKLLLKISSFWQKVPAQFYLQKVMSLLNGHNPNILINPEYVNEDEIAKYYQQSDCFVAPTKGEGFGLTILNAMACGMPVVTTNDKNSGHMDFTKPYDSVVWIQPEGIEEAPKRFYSPGNMLARLSVEEVRKQLRYAYENHKELKEKAMNNSEEIREKFSWEQTAKKIIEYVKE